MKTISVTNKNRFLRSLGKRLDTPSLAARLGLSQGKEYVGKADGEHVLLYRRRRGISSLFALTLYGRWENKDGKDQLTLSYGRCRPLLPIWLFWAFLMAVAGVSLFFADEIFRPEPVLALCFLIPALASLLPLFLHSRKEKERLAAFLASLAALRGD